MADSGQASEGNFATAATAPVDCTSRLSQIRNSTAITNHALTPVREATPPSPCRFSLRGRCRYGCRCSQFHASTVPSQKPCKHFNEDIANSDRIASSAMY
ncbi:hypothetical protein ElyMa_004608300 [Elysia marginata]|uniref:C3H1-type domain-containing protein n=1 Tax=Elysia marginata TaxID=1093978 RepID=A0AAV4HX14_9GAST|nr:hypothetical protein ElyMa_004608300 [Elysia marginata]